MTRLLLGIAKRTIGSPVVVLLLLLWGLNVEIVLAAGLKKGDRVVFLGDSITEAGAGKGGYVTLVAEALAEKHKDLGVEVIGAGISGNKVPDLEKRLDKDVLGRRPTVVVIYIGINDVWHWQNGKGTTKEDFDSGLRRIIQRLTDANARVILCTPSVIGEKLDGGNPQDKLLAEYCEISRRVATETKTQLLDLNKAFHAVLRRDNKDNAESNVLTTDGVHLNAAGNRLVADQMMSALLTGGSPGQVLRHVVLFKFKDEVSADQVQEVATAFAALPSKIEQICGFEWGTDVSVENKSDGFTHGFVVSFHTAQGRDEYLPHPAHQEFVKLVGPRVDKVLVFDFWAQ